MSKCPGLFVIINKYEENRNLGTRTLPSHWNTLGLLFKSWFICLFIRFIFTTRYLTHWNIYLNVLRPLPEFLWSPSQAHKYISSITFLMLLLLPRVNLRSPPRPAAKLISRYPHLPGWHRLLVSHTAKLPLDYPGARSVFPCLQILPLFDLLSAQILKLSSDGSYAPCSLAFDFILSSNWDVWSYVLMLSAFWLRYCQSNDCPYSICPCLHLYMNGCTNYPPFSHSHLIGCC